MEEPFDGNTRVIAGRYVLRDVLGVGGMGVVYRASDLAAGRTVAIKLLHPQHIGAAATTPRPGAERLAGGSVHHPNVVAVSDAGVAEDGTPFLVMELVRGVPLDDLVHAEGPFALRRATAIVGQLLAGLQALHDAGFVHGDVKSGNVLVESFDGGDAVKLIDLGLARTPEPIAPNSERLASGTPEYMAPEVVRGDGTVPASDIYGAGVVLYQLLTGTTPFEGGASREILRRHLHDIVVPPSLRCPDRTIPGELERAVMMALEKQPSARHPSATAFAAAIVAATPPADLPVGHGEVRQMFSTEAPTQEWAPRELPAPTRRATGSGAVPNAATGRRSASRSRSSAPR
jgi:serine/threonine-protein kinase